MPLGGHPVPPRGPGPMRRPPPTGGPPLPEPAPPVPARRPMTAPERPGASAATGERSRSRLVNPEGAAELTTDCLRPRAGGVGAEHDAVTVVRIARLEHPRREPRARELLRHLGRPRLVL